MPNKLTSPSSHSAARIRSPLIKGVDGGVQSRPPILFSDPNQWGRSIKANADSTFDYINRAEGWGGRGGKKAVEVSISTGTKSIPSRLGRISLLCRAIRRPSDTGLGTKSDRLTTALTVSPSISVSATIQAFNALAQSPGGPGGQFRLPSVRDGDLARNAL